MVRQHSLAIVFRPRHLPSAVCFATHAAIAAVSKWRRFPNRALNEWSDSRRGYRASRYFIIPLLLRCLHSHKRLWEQETTTPLSFF